MHIAAIFRHYFSFAASSSSSCRWSSLSYSRIVDLLILCLHFAFVILLLFTRVCRVFVIGVFLIRIFIHCAWPLHNSNRMQYTFFFAQWISISRVTVPALISCLCLSLFLSPSACVYVVPLTLSELMHIPSDCCKFPFSFALRQFPHAHKV